MNSRIYPKEIYERELDRLRIRYYHCPNCLGCNIDNKIGYFSLIHDYYCIDCDKTFSKLDAITKSKIRDIKIDRILNVY